MLRKVLVASLAVAAVSASLLAARPVEAGSCAALSVSIGKLSTSCKKKGAFYHCTVAAKVCGR
jgi:hypothetical protein